MIAFDEISKIAAKATSRRAALRQFRTTFFGAGAVGAASVHAYAQGTCGSPVCTATNCPPPLVCSGGSCVPASQTCNVGGGNCFACGGNINNKCAAGTCCVNGQCVSGSFSPSCPGCTPAGGTCSLGNPAACCTNTCTQPTGGSAFCCTFAPGPFQCPT